MSGWCGSSFATWLPLNHCPFFWSPSGSSKILDYQMGNILSVFFFLFYLINWKKSCSESWAGKTGLLLASSHEARPIYNFRLVSCCFFTFQFQQRLCFFWDRITGISCIILINRITWNKFQFPLIPSILQISCTNFSWDVSVSLHPFHFVNNVFFFMYFVHFLFYVFFSTFIIQHLGLLDIGLHNLSRFALFFCSCLNLVIYIRV